MYFRNITIEKPNEDDLVLIKLKYSDYDFYNPYMFCFYKSGIFIEATGEQYSSWYEDEVTHWMPIEELSDIEER